MKKCILICLIALLLIVSCKNDPVAPDQPAGDDWTRNIKWQGEYSSFPYNPEEGYAFYNTSDGYSYVYISSQGWTPLAKSGMGLNWIGERSDYPLYPKYGDAFFHSSLGNSYVYDGVSWQLLAKSGANGANGASGILKWVGEFASAPTDPTDGTAYHNTSDGKSYIYTNSKWNVITVDGQGITWLGERSYYPTNPSVNTAFFNTSTDTAYIWNGSEWSTLVSSSTINYNISIQWIGNRSTAPSTPSVGWMYYNTTEGKSYIWDGSCWETVASDGVSPVGFLITWKGSLSTAPSNPKQGWCYHNSVENTSYIYDGTGWKLMVKGDPAAGLHTPSGAKLQVSVDDVVLEKRNGTNFQLDIEYDSEKDSETKTITITNIGTETVYFSEDGPLMNSSVSSEYAAVFDFSDMTTSLEPNCSCSFTITYDPSLTGYNYNYFYLYNTSLENPLGISFTQIHSGTNSNSRYLYVSERMMASGGCHQIMSKTVSITQSSSGVFDSIDFQNCKPSESGQTLELTFSSNTGYAPVCLVGTPFIWIDGDNADEFILSANTTSNLKLKNGGSYSASIRFAPLSVGEKNAVLHVSTDMDGYEDIQIPLSGKCSEGNPFETLGYAVIDFIEPISKSTSYCSLAEDGLGGCYLIAKQSSAYLLDIYHIDSNGSVSFKKSIDGYNLDYVEYSDDKLFVYTNGSVCKTKYGYQYAKVTLDTETFNYSVESYSSEIISHMINPKIAEITYRLTYPYEDFILGLSGSDYYFSLDIYGKEEQFLASVKWLLPYESRYYALCFSGKYLYRFDDSCLRRTSLDEVIEEVKEDFNL